VVVLVLLELRFDQPGADPIGPSLDSRAARGQAGRRKAAQSRDGGRAGMEVDQASLRVGQRLDGPALDPAERGSPRVSMSER